MKCDPVIGEVHGVRHGRIVELIRDFVFDLTVDVKRAARGLIPGPPRPDKDGAVVHLAVAL